MEILTYNFVLGTGNIVGMLRIDSIEVPARCICETRENI
jgi:hypothetical protein